MKIDYSHHSLIQKSWCPRKLQGCRISCQIGDANRLFCPMLQLQISVFSFSIFSQWAMICVLKHLETGIRSPDCGPLSQDQTLWTDWHNVVCPFLTRFASYSHIQMPPFLSADANRLRTLLHAHANTALGWCFREFSVSFKRRLHTRTEPSIDPADT